MGYLNLNYFKMSFDLKIPLLRSWPKGVNKDI